MTTRKSSTSRPPLSSEELRSKAVFRAMNKLLENNAENEAQLWSIARVMSGEEFSATAEERYLAHRCGNPTCSNSPTQSNNNTTTSNSKLKALVGDSRSTYITRSSTLEETQMEQDLFVDGFCSGLCSEAVAKFAQLLGSNGAALARFEVLLDQLREKKKQQRKVEKGEEPAATIDTSSSSASDKKDKDENNLASTKHKLAAGTSKTPIMLAKIQERDPSSSSFDTPSQPSEAVNDDTATDKTATTTTKQQNLKSAMAVDGYVPRAKSNFKSAAQNKQIDSSNESGTSSSARKVRFSDRPLDAGPIYSAQAEEAKVVKDVAVPTPTTAVPATIAESSEADTTATTTTAVNPNTAVFVFDVEDAQGPIEGNDHDLAARFGVLRVADAQNIGLNVDVDVNDAGSDVEVGQMQQQERTQVLTTVAERVSVDYIDPEIAAGDASNNNHGNTTSIKADDVLTERLKQGVKTLFPGLAATLPPEMLQELEAEEASETDSEVASEDWQLSDDENDDDNDLVQGDYVDGERHVNNNATSFSSRFRVQLSFFGELFSHLEAWITDSTHQLLNSQPGEPAPDVVVASNRDMVVALMRFLAIAVPAVMQKLNIAEGRRAEIDRGVGEALRTMRLVGPLPAFKAAQWQVVAIVLLKALSFERLPSLKPAFESRQGITLLHKTLSDLKFTIEELYCVLELLCPPDEGDMAATIYDENY